MPDTLHGIPLPADLTAKPCPTCRQGCGCDPAQDQSCEHYGCWGRQATGTCPGVVYEVARYEAERAHRRAQIRTAQVRRNAAAAVYSRAVAQATSQAAAELAARLHTRHHHR